MNMQGMKRSLMPTLLTACRLLPHYRDNIRLYSSVDFGHISAYRCGWVGVWVAADVCKKQTHVAIKV